jgi:hypothetical protein
MTDLEAFIDLYARFGIDCKVETEDSNTHQFIILLVEDSLLPSATSETKSSGKLTGYNGFYSRIEFDENGKFVQQEFLE